MELRDFDQLRGFFIRVKPELFGNRGQKTNPVYVASCFGKTGSYEDGCISFA